MATLQDYLKLTQQGAGTTSANTPTLVQTSGGKYTQVSGAYDPRFNTAISPYYFKVGSDYYHVDKGEQGGIVASRDFSPADHFAGMDITTLNSLDELNSLLAPYAPGGNLDVLQATQNKTRSTFDQAKQSPKEVLSADELAGGVNTEYNTVESAHVTSPQARAEQKAGIDRIQAREMIDDTPDSGGVTNQVLGSRQQNMSGVRGSRLNQTIDSMGMIQQAKSAGMRVNNLTDVSDAERFLRKKGLLNESPNPSTDIGASPSSPPIVNPSFYQPDFTQQVTGLLEQFGITPSSATQSPVAAFAETYGQLFKSLGLDTIKKQSENLTKQINTIDNDFIDAKAGINEDPWLTEGVRVKKIQQLQDKYEEKRNAKVNELTLRESIYDTGRQDAQFIAQSALTIQGRQQQLTQDIIFKAIDIAEKQAEAQSKLMEFNPANYKEVQGGLFDVQTGQWIINPKVEEKEVKRSAIYQEYQDAKGEGYTGNFIDYQNEDANRKRSVTNVSVGGVSNQTIDNERSLFSQFRGEPIVKDYNTILSKKLSVDQIIQSGVGGPGDLALVYEFMKGLDPSSVVRETEYASAARSGNIFAGSLAKFNGYFKANGGFMPPQTAASFQSIVDGKLKVQQQLYNNVSTQYRDIAARQGLNPDNVALNYSAAQNTPASNVQSASTIQQSTESFWGKAANWLFGD